MNQILTGKFTADGNAKNIDFGFIPSYLKLINATAADTEVWCLEWFNQMGDAQEIWHYIQQNDGGADVTTPVKKASGGYVSEYDANVVGARKSCVFDYTGGAYEDMITVAAGHGYADGERVKFVASGGLAAGLNERTIYYVIYKTPTVFQVSLTKGGSAVAMTSDGTAPNYVYSVDNLQIDVGGGKGVTVSASFMDDSDVIYYMAIGADRDGDQGDSANVLTVKMN